MIRLRVLDGPNKGAALEVADDQVIIGSDPERCTVLLVDRAVRPVHVTMTRISDEEMTVETADDAPISLDGQAVPPGLYATGAVVLLAIGRNEILVQCRAAAERSTGAASEAHAAEPAPDFEAPPEDALAPPAPAPAGRRLRTAALLLLVLAGLTWGFWYLIKPGAPPTTQAGSKPSTPRPPVSNNAEAEDPFAFLQPKAAPASPPATPTDSRALSYDPDPATQAAPLTRLDAGTVLFEPKAPPEPAPAKATQRVLRRFVDDREGLIVETTTGERFVLKSDRRDGYGMRWLSDDEIELQRGNQTLHIKVE